MAKCFHQQPAIALILFISFLFQNQAHLKKGTIPTTNRKAPPPPSQKKKKKGKGKESLVYLCIRGVKLDFWKKSEGNLWRKQRQYFNFQLTHSTWLSCYAIAAQQVPNKKAKNHGLEPKEHDGKILHIKIKFWLENKFLGP